MCIICAQRKPKHLDDDNKDVVLMITATIMLLAVNLLLKLNLIEEEEATENVSSLVAKKGRWQTRISGIRQGEVRH